MLAESLKKVKEWCAGNRGDLFIAGIIFFTGLSGFGLGRLSVDLKQNLPLSITQPTDESADATMAPHDTAVAHPKTSDTRVFASRNGTVYYYSWCSGAKRVKEENKIWFLNNKEAEQAGLTRANGCK